MKVGLLCIFTKQASKRKHTRTHTHPRHTHFHNSPNKKETKNKDSQATDRDSKHDTTLSSPISISISTSTASLSFPFRPPPSSVSVFSSSSCSDVYVIRFFLSGWLVFVLFFYSCWCCVLTCTVIEWERDSPLEVTSSTLLQEFMLLLIGLLLCL